MRQSSPADAGRRFVGIKLVIHNTGQQSESDDANNDVTIIGSDNQSYTATFFGISGCTNFSNGTFNLPPGQTSTGCVNFQLPPSVNPAKVQFTPSSGFSNQTGQWLVP